MKKLILVLIAVIMLSFAIGMAISASAAEPVVYVCEGGKGDGSSESSPLGLLSDAYKKLGDNGGKIVICGSYKLASNFHEPDHTGKVTVTQKHGSKDYRNGTANSLYIVGQGRRYFLAGPTTFENINFKGDLSAQYNYILWVAQFNPIVMGEGITSIDFKYGVVAQSLGIVGGVQGGDGKATSVTTDLDSKITINSGKFLVVGFSRQANTGFTGCAHIDITGGEITTLYAGSINNGWGGDAVINISGGSFTGAINCSNTDPSYMRGDPTINITGGDFSKCTSITGNIDGYSKIDISTHPSANVIKTKLASFDEVVTADGVGKVQSTDEAFLSGSFTDSKGTVIPYRYYLPDNYDASKTYPVFFYLHGNGSRGSDNKIQLTTNGAALNNKVFSSDYECIMLAPQCPSSSSWVNSSRYPGSAAFNGSTEMSQYLNAAKELLDKFIADYSVDTSRIYVTGSSNGGGATWELIYRFPRMFAAAIPIAGSGSSDGAAEIGAYLTRTPIMTFHGDADSTLSVLGTRKLVEAIKSCGGQNVIYTEFPGADHNIWSKAANTDGIVDWIFSQVNTNYSANELDYSAGVPDVVDTSNVSDTTDVPSTDGATVGDNTTATTQNGADDATTDKGGNTIVIIIACIAAALAIALVLYFVLKKKSK